MTEIINFFEFNYLNIILSVLANRNTSPYLLYIVYEIFNIVYKSTFHFHRMNSFDDVRHSF